VTKLTIPDLWVIAACHGVYLHSKQHLTHIQNTILEHKCTGCSEYVCVFEPVNEEKNLVQKKASNLKAVKKWKISANQIIAVVFSYIWFYSQSSKLSDSYIFYHLLKIQQQLFEIVYQMCSDSYCTCHTCGGLFSKFCNGPAEISLNSPRNILGICQMHH
jgi:hypothetical protein